jgi:glycosyltransferase involved in cell wall biosynthesis
MNSFTHVLDTGDRLDSTALAPPLGSNVDVQIIGPLTKASGLGVAARLSHSALLKTPFSSHAVRFDMDNPTPEIPDSKHVSTQYRPAKVNLIHLNAELLPEFAAYAPDVMSDAYNIGFFFWEMDHPAACHFLGMGLLDEIWVASEYCKKTYEPFSEVPVINVGLAATPLPQVDHAAVRKTLRQDCGFSQDSFVFVTTLDSYSFVQRKNPTAVIAAFELAFAGKPDVKLVIKSQNRKKVKDAAQDLVWAQMEQASLRNPNIVLVDDTLSYQGVIDYIAGADCYVSLHRAEGWGFGMIEAMQLSVPVICTGYSGNLEFCTEETSYLVDFDMISVDKDDYLYVEKGQTWADPNIGHAAQHMQKVYSDPQSVTHKIAAAHKILDEKFNVGSLADRFEERLKSQI